MEETRSHTLRPPLHRPRNIVHVVCKSPSLVSHTIMTIIAILSGLSNDFHAGNNDYTYWSGHSFTNHVKLRSIKPVVNLVMLPRLTVVCWRYGRWLPLAPPHSVRLRSSLGEATTSLYGGRENVQMFDTANIYQFLVYWGTYRVMLYD